MEKMDMIKKDDVEIHAETISVDISLQSQDKDKLVETSKKLEEFLKQNSISFEKNLKKKFGEITTRRAPSGQGTSTFSRYKLVIHQYNIKIECEHQLLTRAAFVVKTDSVQVRFNILN